MAFTTRRFSVKSVAIIGAGPSGLAAAKYLLAENAFEKIDVFEQRNNVGGIWEYTPESSGDDLCTVPQVSPHVHQLVSPAQEDREQLEGWRETSKKKLCFLSPIYERLETNIPRSLMRYSDAPFPEYLPLFPTHQSVQQYLEKYAQDLRSIIHLQTHVIDVRYNSTMMQQNSVVQEIWTLDRVDLRTGLISTTNYDAVIVASGHFSTPYIPDISGLQKWASKYQGSILHSKNYRKPEAYAGKTVIVVGNAASGLDISSQLVSVCKHPVLLSQKSESYLAAGFKQDPNIELVPQIAHFNAEQGTIIFSDGRVVKGVDIVLFCTGYLYTMPFLKSLRPNPINTGERVEHTYQHLFYAPHPTLSFLALPQKVVPFPLSEAQAAVLARVYSNRLSIPSEDQMIAWEQSTIAQQRDRSGFHTLKFPKDADYINMLYDLAESAEPRGGLQDDGKGKLPRRWDKWEYWCRERFPAIRKAFVQRGENRKNVTKLEELGFWFEKPGLHEEPKTATEHYDGTSIEV